ncbi:hypothetical protein Y032_0002g815 [Ancylostoma ceylanicum]|nr:hypothetical protein Y032_0002g815 [Ancylostoma ceylanicum]
MWRRHAQREKKLVKLHGADFSFSVSLLTDLARETENSVRSTDTRDYSVDDTSATCDLSLDAPSSRASLPKDAATAAHRYEAENDDPRSREQLLRTPRDSAHRYESYHRARRPSRERSRTPQRSSRSRNDDTWSERSLADGHARYSHYRERDYSRSPRPRRPRRNRTPELALYGHSRRSRYLHESPSRDRSRSPMPATPRAVTPDRSYYRSRQRMQRRDEEDHSPDPNERPSHHSPTTFSRTRTLGHDHLERSREEYRRRERSTTPRPRRLNRETQAVVANQVVSLTERASNSIRGKCVDLEKLGAAVARHEGAGEFEEFVREKLKDVRINVAETKTIHKAISSMPNSSDSVVRGLVSVVKSLSETVIGMSTVMDGLLTSQEALRNSVKAASNNITRMTQMKLPPGVFLSAGNIVGTWIVPNQPPFVVGAMRLTQLQ